MARTNVSISAAVGIRNGTAVQPNTPRDLAIVTELLDRISAANGGAKGVPGEWETDRTLLIAEVTAFIIAFQTANRPTVDGVIDRSGGTLKAMNAMADEPPLAAVVAPAPGGRPEVMDVRQWVATVASVPGRDLLRKTGVGQPYTRKLVRVDKSSVKWYGVVIPATPTVGRVPHVFFTPTPHQGGYEDPTYGAFSAWGQLWDDYTARMGGQMAAAGVDEIMVIPFYKNGQSQGLGDFETNWQDVISLVATAGINAVDPLLLRTDTYQFDSLVSSSFSNGWIAHKPFNRAAAAMTTTVFDIDGAAAQPSSISWRPRGMVKYINKPVPPNASNPIGVDFYVGDRWKEIAEIYAPQDRHKTHHMCSAHLLFHGLSTFCRR